MKRKELIDKAREYIDTPFHHQGRVKGVGVDCIGLIVCVLKELNVNVDDVIGYASSPNSNVFVNAVESQTIKITKEQLKVGDLILVTYIQNEPQHIAFISNYENGKYSIIHSLSWCGKVVEHILEDKWFEKISGYHRIKNINFED